MKDVVYSPHLRENSAKSDSVSNKVQIQRNLNNDIVSNITIISLT